MIIIIMIMMIVITNNKNSNTYYSVGQRQAPRGSQQRLAEGRRAVGKKTASVRKRASADWSISSPPKLTSVTAERSFQNMWPLPVQQVKSFLTTQP